MNLVWTWLNDWIELRGPVDAVTSTLIQAGVEIADVTECGADFPQVVVARILSSEPHPDADRLSVCQVDDGSGTPRQIVCGAKNYSVGDHVPLALPGAVLPGDFKIKVGKLRGVRSEGMMCSAKELRLAEDAAGLLILPHDTTVGTPIGTLFPAETVITLEVTPNRPDLLSHRGIARLLNAHLGWPLKQPTRPTHPTLTIGAIEPLPVEVVDPKACPLYTARRICGVHVGPSPDWLRRRLELAGLRSINNVVDVTNYLLLDIGQPLHAFDAARLDGGRIVVRPPQPGETITTLDDSQLTLAPHQLVIADATQPQALAGVIGGKWSGVDTGATEIVLESAWFTPANVRLSARTAAVSTDSSYRFERGADPAAVQEASDLAAAMITSIAGGTAGPTTVAATPSILEPRTVPLRNNRVNALLGAQLSTDQIADYLQRIGCRPVADGWQPPLARIDLTREVDLIEEIAHLHGLHNIPARIAGPTAPESATDRLHDTSLRLLRQLAALGFHEVRNLTLQPETPPAPPLAPRTLTPVAVRNPLTIDHVTLRTSLLPGMLLNVVRNVRAGVRAFQLCERGHVYDTDGQTPHLALLISGPAGVEGWWSREQAPQQFAHLRGFLETLLPTNLHFQPVDGIDGYQSVFEIMAGAHRLGLAARLAPALERSLEIPHPVWTAELRLDSPAFLQSDAAKFREYPRLPAVTRDIAFSAPRTLRHEEVMTTITNINEPLLESVQLFDLFEDPTGTKLAADRKSMAYSLVYRATDRTLTAQEAAAAHDRIRTELLNRLPVEVRA